MNCKFSKHRGQALWEWSLKKYANPKTEHLCLSLQDEFGNDVNVLLWVCWLADQGQSPHVEAADPLITFGRNPEARLLAGLRRARRDLVQDNDSGAENDSSTLKQALLDAELGLEKRRQYQLADLPVVDAGSGSALELARYNFTWLHAAATPIGSPMPRPDPRLLRQFYDLCLQIIV